jgi:hypothetical protein
MIRLACIIALTCDDHATMVGPGDQLVAPGARDPSARLVSKPGANSTVEVSDIDQSVKSRMRSRLAS